MLKVELLRLNQSIEEEMEEEKLRIICPLCTHKHEYCLDVDRTFVLYHMTSEPDTSKRTVKRFKRVFVCPDKNEKFQAVIKMESGFGEVINDVKVREELAN
ncbi:TPA: hypothetical protein P0E15_005044 [Vibrio harveyi]|nr:hypothetical protein [Vibrio harveyi]